MVKNKASYNVLKAISIGLAASMALMPTATVFADDGDSNKRERRHSRGIERSDSGQEHKKSHHSERSEEAKQEVSEARQEAVAHFNEYHPVEENT